MSKVQEIEAALRKLPTRAQWEVARWLLDELEEEAGSAIKDAQHARRASALPDYAARRRRIFGDKVLPNMVLLARSEERR